MPDWPIPEGVERYFDNAATTPLDPRVLDAMLPFLKDGFGNAHSLHHFGRRAMAAVDSAREHVSALIEADDPAEVVFTSGATEANNWVLAQFDQAAISPFEHSSVREPALRRGLAILPNRDWTLIPDRRYALISAMTVNNETGACLDLDALRPSAQRLHTDATQAVAKLPVRASEFDYLSFSGHKMHGPKGIGVLYARGAEFPQPFILGGEQESGLRGGTLNVAAIVGLGEAARLAHLEQEAALETIAAARAAFLEAVQSGGTGVQINDSGHQSPAIVSVSFLGVEGETLVIETDAAGFGISSGAACSSRSAEPSHVLTALGLPPAYLRGTVRVSFSKYTQTSLASHLGQLLAQRACHLAGLV